MLSFCLLNYFVDLHPNVAEGIQISFLLEESLGSRDINKQSVVGNDRFDYKYEIHAMQKSYKDGQCC